MMTKNMTVGDARKLMESWVANPALRIHMECVAACCAAYARDLDPENSDKWTVTGLLHDFDYEKHPTAEEHPYVGVAHLRELGVNNEICVAILGHADYTNTPRESQLAKVLFAVDEISGFIVACSKVRPKGISDLKPKSVLKKLKDKAFAAAVNRNDIAQGIEELGVERNEHLQKCIDAIRTEADRLGL